MKTFAGFKFTIGRVLRYLQDCGVPLTTATIRTTDHWYKIVETEQTMGQVDVPMEMAEAVGPDPPTSQPVHHPDMAEDDMIEPSPGSQPSPLDVNN